ncbi:MAG: hypothetical protein BGO01_07475 [Armatimonadetes bacterium 55-13]|nr:hypothetical protein [Armatimonadota bacterium]OJU63703.1 MAG: hypothetical protein BGO01_07475 [Armatimonadetes bacterium 55-13]
MRKFLPLCAIFVAAASALAQDSPPWPTPSAESRKYHEYRKRETTPTYGLSKVKAIIAKIKETDEGDMILGDDAYNALSLKEKFTYTMLHGEYFTQICDVIPPIQDEQKKIFGYFPSPFNDEQMWSKRQKEFLHKNRVEIIKLIRETIKAKGTVGVNLKEAIMETNAVELIPDLIAQFGKDKKDYDLLTVMMLLMKVNNYPAFKASASYKKLYGDESNYQAFIANNSANQKLIISRATAFYKSKKK